MPSLGHHQGWGRGVSLPVHAPSQRASKVRRQLVGSGFGSGGQGSYDHAHPRGKRVQLARHQVTQPPGDAIPHHGVTHGPAHDEAHPRELVGRSGRFGCGMTADRSRSRSDRQSSQMHDHSSGRRPVPGPHHGAELVTAPNPPAPGQHVLCAARPTDGRGPCPGETRRSTDLPACSCACGNRACGHGAGCWAGRCAS
jgi:hypothetical protein